MDTFSISDEQMKKINEWIATHEKRYVGAIGGRYTYSFTPTSLGVIIQVEDSLTEEKLDVTDYLDW